jgi:hypothetical protein
MYFYYVRITIGAEFGEIDELALPLNPDKKPASAGFLLVKSSLLRFDTTVVCPYRCLAPDPADGCFPEDHSFINLSFQPLLSECAGFRASTQPKDCFLTRSSYGYFN